MYEFAWRVPKFELLPNPALIWTLFCVDFKFPPFWFCVYEKNGHFLETKIRHFIETIDNWAFFKSKSGYFLGTPCKCTKRRLLEFCRVSEAHLPTKLGWSQIFFLLNLKQISFLKLDNPLVEDFILTKIVASTFTLKFLLQLHPIRWEY